jgi:hypothetical protein
MKEIRTQWDHGCSKILQDARLSTEQRIKVVMDWLAKAGIRDFVLGKLIQSFARPLPIPPTDDQRKQRRQKTLIRLAYDDDIPHLQAVNHVVTERLNTVPKGTTGSLALIDKRDDREKETPGTMFAEFARSIDAQATIEYQAAKPNGNDDGLFA